MAILLRLRGFGDRLLVEDLLSGCQAVHWWRSCGWIRVPAAWQSLGRSPHSLPLRRGYADIDVVSDIASMPLPDNSFEVVICTDVLEHVLNPWQAVLEIGRLLKSHGCMGVAAAD